MRHNHGKKLLNRKDNLFTTSVKLPRITRSYIEKLKKVTGLTFTQMTIKALDDFYEKHIGGNYEVTDTSRDKREGTE